MASKLQSLLLASVAFVLLTAALPVTAHHVPKSDGRIVNPYGIQVLFHVPVAAGYEPVPTPEHCQPGAGAIPASIIYSQDFEGSHGYSFLGTSLAQGATNLWRVTTSGGVGSDAGHTGPTRLYYGNNAGNINSGHTAGVAQSPPIALPNNPVYLKFATKWQVEWLKGYDHLWVEARAPDGKIHLLCTANAYDRADPAGLAGNTIVASCSPFHTNPCPAASLTSWETRLVQLPAALQGKTINLRFTFDSADDKANPYMGWMVDDVQIITI